MIVKENVNNIKEFNYLYDAVNWGSYDDNITEIALKNTLYSVSIYDNDCIVGYGRIIGDNICFFYIQDVMVVPKYQGKGIGTMIMKKLIDYVKERQNINPDLRLYLGASKGKEDFYKRFNFVTRKEYGIGDAMIWRNND